jgi:hypothetical protein
MMSINGKKERRSHITMSGGCNMNIKAVIVDCKPNDCILCPLVVLRKCGTEYIERAGSGAVRYGKKPDKNCLLRVQNK